MKTEEYHKWFNFSELYWYFKKSFKNDENISIKNTYILFFKLFLRSERVDMKSGFILPDLLISGIDQYEMLILYAEDGSG